ncbi:hypothetical protein F4780DRAFT_444213 [Xylariomycetidae sp. FL0641]|nr:hypothetical protein F4780DRAFT_444213 [Xylariomycetidae sp. FL0641]
MAEPEPKKSLLSKLDGWGRSSVAPAGLATLITALHFRPFRAAPMTLVPVLLFSSYANLQGFKIDSAGIGAAASGTYALLAFRRRPDRFLSRFTVGGVVRVAALGLGVANALAGFYVYGTGNRKAEKEERTDNPRWVE